MAKQTFLPAQGSSLELPALQSGIVTGWLRMQLFSSVTGLPNLILTLG